jgi:predicted ATPase
MLTRLRVKGFKNLVDVEVFFGPLTCVAGANGVGKSNLFDAIVFLSKLADERFVEAARAVRGGDDLRGLFTAPGRLPVELEADMLIPREGVDEYGKKAEASSTMVRYAVALSYASPDDRNLLGVIRLESEELTYLSATHAKKALWFPHSKSWYDNVVKVGRRTEYISTKRDPGVVRLHWDRATDSGGRPPEFVLAELPKTVLTSARSAQETRTAVLVRKEMRSWRLLQLEPTALRTPSKFQDETHLGTSGNNLPAAFYRLAHLGNGSMGADPAQQEAKVYQTAANRVAELVEGVGTIQIDRNEARQELVLKLKERGGLEIPAASLSDGTLRFLALALLEQDPEETGVICMEEPENGIHPRRVGKMVQLLEDIAVDPTYDGTSDNPLRQVLINTHSPSVVVSLPAENLLMAVSTGAVVADKHINALALRGVRGTKRAAHANTQPITLNDIVRYLGGAVRSQVSTSEGSAVAKGRIGDMFQTSFQFRDQP